MNEPISMPFSRGKAKRPASRRSPKRREVAHPEETAKLLEDQLGSVIEQPGVHISAAPSARRVSRAVRTEARAAPSAGEERVRGFDLALVNRAAAPKTVKAGATVQIRHEAHAESEHVLALPGTARRILIEPRKAFGPDIRTWLAPYEIPPALEALAAETDDLFIDEVDPRHFTDQYTPGDAEIAFAERYRWWKRLRSPFIRWEVAGMERQAKIESEPNIELQTMSFDDQMTPADSEEAYRSVYGPWRKLTSVLKRGFQKTENVVEEAVEEIADREEDLVAQVEEAWGVPVLVPRVHLARVMAGFFGLLVLASLPAGAISLSRSFGASLADAEATSRAAVSEIRQALETGDRDTLVWGDAVHRFQDAERTLTQANTLAVAIVQALPNTRSSFQSARSLLVAGEKSAEAGRLLLRGVARAFEEPALHPDERLITFSAHLDAALPLLEDAETSLHEVRADRLPEDIRPRIASLGAALSDGRVALRELRALLGLSIALVGHDRPRTYLLVFQNNAELRPTGGFMGSVAEIVLDRGEIKKIRVPGGGPYDLRDQLMARVAAPKPLQLVDARWEFQDANWFPDFPAAADKIRWFWSKSGQPTLDGLVSVNASVLPDILKVTGPIELPEYGKTITSENVLAELQIAVELEYDRTENKPKKIVGDLFDRLLKRLKDGNRDDWLSVSRLLAQSLETKDVQVALFNEEEASVIAHLGWDGRLKDASGDSLAVVLANIAGQKTDAAIEERVRHEAMIQPDGSIIDTVTLERTHTGVKGELFHGANNVEYLRVYAPLGAELLSADGFMTPSSTYFKQPLTEDPPDADLERLVKPATSTVPDVDVTEEFGRTAFGGWIQLEPGDSSTTTFRYRLPFTVYDLGRQLASRTSEAKSRAAYTLLFSSQSGKVRTLLSEVRLPEGWETSWTNMNDEAGALKIKEAWKRDRAFAALLQTPHANIEEAAR